MPDPQAADATDALLSLRVDDIKDLRKDVADLKADTRLLKWMAGVSIALGVALFLRLFAPAAFQ